MDVLDTKLYKVRVPVIATYSDFDIEVMGVARKYENGSYGKPDYDTPVIVMFSIRRILNTFTKGLPVYLVDRDKLEDLRYTLEEYLANRGSSNGRHRRYANEDELETINEFLEEMFDYNKESIVEQAFDFGKGFDLNIVDFNSTPLTDVKASDTSISVGETNINVNGFKRVKRSTYRRVKQ